MSVALSYLIGTVLIFFIGWVVFETSKMIDERNKWRNAPWRRRTVRYYYGVDDDTEDDVHKESRKDNKC